MERRVYNILEVANVHGGSFSNLLSLIGEYENYGEGWGIKFQPFKYDYIALPDFSWYNVYQELFFTPQQWKEVILKSVQTKDVWIDCFDDYSFQIAKENLNNIKGIKFQSTVLYNKNLVAKFSSLDLKEKLILLNISGYEIPEIREIVTTFSKVLNAKQIILQIGFQAYPNIVKDSGLSKIELIKKEFNYPVSFADHITPDSEDAYILPMIAVMLGCEFIEKHICKSGPQPKYDFYSSLNPDQYKKFIEVQSKYINALKEPFINLKESDYLTSSLQIPILNKEKKSGDTLSLEGDFAFKRSNQKGLTTSEISKYSEGLYVLSSNKFANSTIELENIKKANIASIIACRLKSSRLPRKALLKIGDLSSVEFCIKSALSFENVNMTVLATSTVEEDAVLEKHTYSNSVVFEKGDPVDVMQRFLDVVNKYKIDVFIRITADMPFVSNEILKILLTSHFKEGADYTRAKEAAVGTNLEIINSAALRKAKSFFPDARYSEYMTYYFINNPDYFKINEVSLPENLVRDYRLTLDYQEDLDMFNKVWEGLKAEDLNLNLPNIIGYLDKHPEVSNINKGLEIKYHTDKDLVDKLNKYTKVKK